MKKHCVFCGAPLAHDSKFCGNCGNQAVSNSDFSSLDAAQSADNSGTSSTTSTVRIKWSALIAIVVVLFWGIRNIGPKIDRSWAVKEACSEVKSDVYNTYGEIAHVSGDLIYRDGQHHIIAVKYSIPEFDWQASCACLVYGYRESNCSVTRMTNEMSYDYNYKANLEDLKALWALD